MPQEDFKQLDDDQLIARCRSYGSLDDRLWTEFIRRHRQFVWSVCGRYFRNKEDVADMVQETLFRAVRGLGGFEGEQAGRLRSWLATIAGNTCKNELRSRSRRLLVAEKEVTPDMAIFHSVALANSEASQRGERLKQALQTVSESDREIIHLADLEEVPYREIAAMLEISLSAVKMRVLRARTALASAIRSQEQEVTEV